MRAKVKAEYARRNHISNGGTLSTAQIAEQLGCTTRLVAYYIANAIAQDKQYTPSRQRLRDVDRELIAMMVKVGFPKARIAAFFGVTPPTISYTLKKGKPNE